MVAQLYYKKNFNIRELLIIPGETKETQLQNPLPGIGEKKKRGRKNGFKTNTVAAKESAVLSEDVSGKKSAGGAGRRGRPSLNNTNNPNSTTGGNNHVGEGNRIGGDSSLVSKEEISLGILDYLINPLKTDYVFGNFAQFISITLRVFCYPKIAPKFIIFIFLLLELWSPKEIAIFESAMCKFGR